VLPFTVTGDGVEPRPGFWTFALAQEKSGAFLHKDTANCDTFTKIGRNEGHTMLINLRPCSGASRRFRPSVKNSTKSNVLSN